MGKPKKGKKANKDDDFEEDLEVDPVAIVQESEASESVTNDTKQAGGKKGKKGRKKKDDDWEDDVAAEIAALSLQKGDEDDEAIHSTSKELKAKKKKDKKKMDDFDDDTEADQVTSKPTQKGPSAFMMLGIEDESTEDLSSEEEEIEKVKSEEMPKVKQDSFEKDQEADGMEEPKPQQSKKNKKKGKQKDKKTEEEDFDAILAEFGAPQSDQQKTEITGKKKKGKKEKVTNVEEAMELEGAEESGIDLTKDISQMTEEELEKYMGIDNDDDEKKKRKGKKQKGKEESEEVEKDSEQKEEEDEEEDEDGGTVKTAAQKKKEKKERQKQKKLEEASKKKKGAKESTPDTQEGTSTDAGVVPETIEDDVEGESKEAAAVAVDGEEAEEDSNKKKRDRKKKKGKEPEEEKKKKPSKMALALQEQLKKMKDEEEQHIREEEEKERKREELIQQKEEKARLEKEKKDREKQKKKEKIDRLKAEGKYMTAKQKEAMKMAQAKLEAMKAAGIEIPSIDKLQDGEKKKKVVYDSRPKKKKQFQKQPSPTDEMESKETTPELVPPMTEVEVREAEPAEEEKSQTPEEPADTEEETEDIKDAWDVSSEEEDDIEEKVEVEKKSVPQKITAPAKTQVSFEDEDEESDDDDEDDDDDDESDESESEEEDHLKASERARERALARIQKRKEEADNNKSTDRLRAPVVCVLGHVDTGKTKILDKLRRTNVQDGEAGGITQQIGATNVPEDTIREQTKMCKDFLKKELKIPGLLIIDTPGHESFSNLRTRGSSLCDIAILVVDIMHGLEPQTIESINLLKARKTPFVIALNKVDRLFQWQPNPHNDVMNTIKKQKPNTKLEFDERAQQAVVQFAEQGLNVALFYENKNPREYFSLVPTSAHSGDGMGNLIALVCEMSQSMLAKRLAYSEELQATVMEVKALPGMGTTIDVILVNGSIREAATIVVAGQEGPIVTTIRGLLLPQPLKELRVKGAYENKKEVFAAQGCKIMAKDLDKALAGLPLYIAQHEDEIEIYKEEIAESLEEILGSIKLTERGVFVQASTLGSLEALLEFLKTSKIPYAGINIGPVHKRDIMKASVMLEHDSQYAVILAFDVKIEREAQEMADGLGVQIFTADIIYHLFDKFMAYRDNLKKQKQEEFKNIAVFPCKIRVLPQYIFNSRDPIVCGVIVESGFMKIGTPLCVPSKEFLYLGYVTSLEVNHKPTNKAVKGQEVCVKIESPPGETPKLFGRHFDHTDIVTSKISRQSIDAVKNYFREEMSKNDWQLMVELKKLFEII